MLNGLRWRPESVSTYGAEVDGIIALIYSLTLGWFSLTMWTSGLRSRQSH